MRHFLSCVLRLLGLEHEFGQLIVDGRPLLVDTFPMGIDVEKYNALSCKPSVMKEIRNLHSRIGNCKVILSVARLDFSKGIIEGLQANLERVAITELRANTFFAKIVFRRNNEVLTIDARPSDSIALALRTGSPIFVAEDLFNLRGRKPDPKDSAQRLRDFLEGMDPEDFGNLSL